MQDHPRCKQFRFKSFPAKVERIDIAVNPTGIRQEEGVLNPASATDRDGNLLLFTRSVAKGNVSSIEILKLTEDATGALQIENLGVALEAQEWYELAGDGEGAFGDGAVGQGCEDPRVTFMPELDRYVMVYTGFSKQGPRPCIAISQDAYAWERLGPCTFPEGLHQDDKDGMFFPARVKDPNGVECFAMYHRPMVHVPMTGNMNQVGAILKQPARKRQCIRIAYVPVAEVLADIRNLTQFATSHLVMAPGRNWGLIKLGAGTPPVEIEEGLLSLYHGVDAVDKGEGKFAMRYSAGLVIHDPEQPHKIRYRSAQPLFFPETEEELLGIVNDVVFPTAIVPRNDLGARIFDVYYGMADFRIGRIRMTLGAPKK